MSLLISRIGPSPRVSLAKRIRLSVLPTMQIDGVLKYGHGSAESAWGWGYSWTHDEGRSTPEQQRLWGTPLVQISWSETFGAAISIHKRRKISI